MTLSDLVIEAHIDILASPAGRLNEAGFIAGLGGLPQRTVSDNRCDLKVCSDCQYIL